MQRGRKSLVIEKKIFDFLVIRATEKAFKVTEHLRVWIIWSILHRGVRDLLGES